MAAHRRHRGHPRPAPARGVRGVPRGRPHPARGRRRPAAILDELEAIAPVTAVYGNTDGWELRRRLPEVATVRARRLHHRRHPRRPARLAHAREAASRVSRRRDHRLRPHPPPAAHAGGCRGHRDEPGRGRAPALRPAGLRRHPGARARASRRAAGWSRSPRSIRTSPLLVLRRLAARSCSRAGAPAAAAIRHASAPRHRAASGGRRAHRQRRLGSAAGARSPRRRARPRSGCFGRRTRFVAVAVTDRSRSWADGWQSASMWRAIGRPPRRTTTSSGRCGGCSTAAWSIAAGPDDGSRRAAIPTGGSVGAHGRWMGGEHRRTTRAVWSLVLRLDPAWLDGEQGRRPGIGFIIHDDDPNRWYGWPLVTTPAGQLRAHAGVVGTTGVNRGRLWEH